MPSTVVAARVPPYVHARLTERAAERGTSLAAVAAEALAAAVDDPEDRGPRVDGPLVAAVLHALEAVDADDPRAQVQRELCLLLARTVDRKERGYLAAIGPLGKALDHALPDEADPLLGALFSGLL
jgi:hypothetical protein